MSEPTSRGNAALAVAVAVFALAFFAVGVWQLQDRTVDDGFIFFRLAENIANGHGFVWNVGGEPTDGATNFLHLIGLSALIKLGIDARLAGILLTSFSVIAIFILIARAFRARLGAMLPAGIAVLALYLVDERMTINGAVGGLGHLTDGLMAVCVWMAAMSQLKSPSKRSAMILATASFFACIARPSGILFTFVLYLVLLVNALGERKVDHGDRLRAWLIAAFSTLVLGALFALFKWNTFGYLLTNPFYLKSSARFDIQWGAAGKYALYVLTPLALPLLTALAFTTRDGLRAVMSEPRAKTRLFATLLPPLIVVGYYVSATVVAVANFRFFYSSYIFFFVGFLALLPACRRGSEVLRSRALLLSALVALGFGVYRGHADGLLVFPPERAEMRPLEAVLKDIGVALGTTELGHEATVLNDSAGAIPYFSGFRHIDRGGLANNHLSGREPITGLEREEYIWSQELDLYIGFEPPALLPPLGWHGDPASLSLYVQACLLKEARDATSLRTFAQTPELLRLRMQELRANWRMVGQLGPVSYWDNAWSLKYFAYVRKNSPHADAIAKSLEDLVEIKPGDVDLTSISKHAERDYLKKLFAMYDGDFALMAVELTGDPTQAKAVKARYRKLVKR